MNNRCSLAEEEEVEVKVKELEEVELGWSSCNFSELTDQTGDGVGDCELDGPDGSNQKVLRFERDFEGRIDVGLAICVCLKGRGTQMCVSVCVFPSLRPQSDLSNRPSQEILQLSAHSLPFRTAPLELPLP